MGPYNKNINDKNNISMYFLVLKKINYSKKKLLLLLFNQMKNFKGTHVAWMMYLDIHLFIS
jgi:hypothetical protein